MNSIDKALNLAYKTARSTSWEAEPIYDHRRLRLYKETIRSQLEEHILSSKELVILMFAEWALTGKWSKFQKKPVYFAREVLIWSMDQNHENQYSSFPNTPPPWESKFVSQFLNITIFGWLKFGAKEWLNERTNEFFELQEDSFDSYNSRM